MRLPRCLVTFAVARCGLRFICYIWLGYVYGSPLAVTGCCSTRGWFCVRYRTVTYRFYRLHTAFGLVGSNVCAGYAGCFADTVLTLHHPRLPDITVAVVTLRYYATCAVTDVRTGYTDVLLVVWFGYITFLPVRFAALQVLLLLVQHYGWILPSSGSLSYGYTHRVTAPARFVPHARLVGLRMDTRVARVGLPVTVLVYGLLHYRLRVYLRCRLLVTVKTPHYAAFSSRCLTVGLLTHRLLRLHGTRFTRCLLPFAVCGLV